MKVEIWSDVACPWCFIGKRRFQTALADFPHRDQVEVVWRSFELNPGVPPDVTMPIIDFVTAHKGITAEAARELFTEVTHVAADEGLAYDFATAQHANTFTAHRLVHFAARHGLGDAMKERLLSAYFERGESVGDLDILVAIAAEVGLDAAQAREVLGGYRYAAEVRGDEAEALRRSITVVPTFVIDGTDAVSGALKPTVFAKFLHAAWTRTHPPAMTSTSTGGLACGPPGCA